MQRLSGGRGIDVAERDHRRLPEEDDRDAVLLLDARLRRLRLIDDRVERLARGARPIGRRLPGAIGLQREGRPLVDVNDGLDGSAHGERARPEHGEHDAEEQDEPRERGERLTRSARHASSILLPSAARKLQSAGPHPSESALHRSTCPSPNPPAAETKQPGLPEVDVNEYGGKRDGVRQSMNRRLFMQLLVFDTPAGTAPDEVARKTADHLRERNIAGVVYADAMSPRGLGLLTWSEDPAHFVRDVRPLFATDALARVELRPASR